MVVVILRADGDGFVLRFIDASTHDAVSIPLGEPVHVAVVKSADTRGRRGDVRLYMNGYRVRRPHWLSLRVNRVRARRAWG